jgi:hypothetical protein
MLAGVRRFASLPEQVPETEWQQPASYPLAPLKRVNFRRIAAWDSQLRREQWDISRPLKESQVGQYLYQLSTE